MQHIVVYLSLKNRLEAMKANQCWKEALCLSSFGGDQPLEADSGVLDFQIWRGSNLGCASPGRGSSGGCRNGIPPSVPHKRPKAHVRRKHMAVVDHGSEEM